MTTGWGNDLWGEGAWGDDGEPLLPDSSGDLGAWGYGPWGDSPWGGGDPDVVLGEHIPFTAVWDIFDLSGVRRPDDMERVRVFIEVSTLGSADSFFVGSFNICSGGTPPDDYPTDTAILLIDRAVAENFTVQYHVAFDSLPPDFSDVVTEHIYLGAWSGQDLAAGFFFSRAGVQYTGEVEISGGNISVVQAQELLPGSSDWLEEGEEYVIRVAVNDATRLTYLFITKASDVALGLPMVLRAILVAKETVAVISDNIHVSVRGTVPNKVCLKFVNYQMSSRFLVDNMPPIALAGDDQAVRFCSIVQLNGSASFDPELTPITYEWRLIDAPSASVFSVEAADGVTAPEVPPTGYTSRLFSATLGQLDTVEPIQLGDVITMRDGSLTIIGKGTSGGSFYVDVEYSQIADSYTNLPFKLLKQAAISGATVAKPTFYPDAVGFYLFDLRVNDGVLSSSPLGLGRSRVLINVVESPLPRACPVDARFLFDYLLSFWRLVEDRDRLATVFEAIVRITATHLYTLWQYEYSRSLRDVQRTVAHRWLHYDLLLPEPVPELTSIRALWRGVRSDPLAGYVSAVAGSTLVVSSPRLPNGVATVTLGSPGVVDLPRYARELEVRLGEVLGASCTSSIVSSRAYLLSTTNLHNVVYPGSVAGRTLEVAIDGAPSITMIVGSPADAEELVTQISAGLPGAVCSLGDDGILRIGSSALGPGSSVVIVGTSTILFANGGPLSFTGSAATGAYEIIVLATVPFTLTSLSTAPGFTYPAVNSLIGGSSGKRVSDRTFNTGIPLSVYAAVVEDDLLVISGDAHRIVRFVDDVTDAYPYQRVVVKDTLPAYLDVVPTPAVAWSIPGWVQSELLNFYDGLVDYGDHVDIEVTSVVGDGSSQITLIETEALGVCSALPSRLGINTAMLEQSLTSGDATVRLARIVRRHYAPISEEVEDVPILNDTIEVEDPDTVLRRNVDYFLEYFRGRHCLRFCIARPGDLGSVWEADRPPLRLWAEYTYVNNEEFIEGCFGIAAGLRRDAVPAAADYLSAVRGIYYAIYNGPTIYNLRVALQIFLGLPFAEVAGTILEIRTDYFSQRSRILIRDTDNVEIVRSYVYPRVLSLEVNPYTGVEYQVGDTVAAFAPLVTGAEVIDWVKDPNWCRGLVSQGLFSEVQKYHTFLVRVDYEAFNLEAMALATAFIAGVKPKYTDAIYLVFFRVSGDGDEIDITDSVTFNLKLTLIDALCADRLGASYRFDEPWPGGAAYGKIWRNSFDTDDDPATPDPVYPGPSDAVYWAWDKMYLCPEDELTVEDLSTITRLTGTFAGPLVFPQTFSLGVVAGPGTLSRILVQLRGTTGTITESEWVVELLVDSVAVASLPFTLARDEYQMPGPALVKVVTIPRNVQIDDVLDEAVVLGQTVDVVVRAANSAPQSPSWTEVFCAVTVG